MASLSSQVRAKQIELITDPKIKAKESEYYKYCTNHIHNVQVAWENINKNSECVESIRAFKISSGEAYQDQDFKYMLDSQIAVHDNSKFSDAEWDAYRKNFYPINEEEKISAAADFDHAWIHHYENNMHHWDYWYHKDMMNKMPINYVIEMCCDWIAMSMVMGGTAIEWYQDQIKKNTIHIGPSQRQFIYVLLTEYYKSYK